MADPRNASKTRDAIGITIMHSMTKAFKNIKTVCTIIPYLAKMIIRGFSITITAANIIKTALKTVIKVESLTKN